MIRIKMESMSHCRAHICSEWAAGTVDHWLLFRFNSTWEELLVKCVCVVSKYGKMEQCGTQSNTFHTSANASVNHISYINKIQYFDLYAKKKKRKNSGVSASSCFLISRNKFPEIWYCRFRSTSIYVCLIFRSTWMCPCVACKICMCIHDAS